MSIAKIAREMLDEQEKLIADRKAEAAKGGTTVFMSNQDPIRVSIYGVSSDEIYDRVVQVLDDLAKEIHAANRD